MQKDYYDTFDFVDDDNSNSWVITTLIKSVPIVINSVLDEDERQTFCLIFYKDLSQRECASVLGKSRSSINRTYHKAIEKLTTHLQVVKDVLEIAKKEQD